jgi:ABC-type multidrug transport system fused ATPase/permease subunit
MDGGSPQKSANFVATQMPASLFSLLGRLWGHITPRRRGQFGLLLLLMVLASLVEIVSIGAVLPFLGVLTAPERVFANPTFQPLIQLVGVTSSNELLLILTLLFGVAAVLAGSMRLLLLWATTRLSFATGADLSTNIYRRTLYQPYAVHVARNSSEIINGIASKTSSVINTIMTLLSLVGSTVMLVGILVALLAVEPTIALAAFGGFGIIYGCIARFTQRQLLVNSQIVARESTYVIKSLQEGLGGIRDVLIDGSQDAYCKIYRDSDLPFRKALGSTTFISASPRFAMEALGMLLIAVLAYSLARQPDGIAKAIPILGALALGAQRLLPVLQQAYTAWASVNGSQASLQDALELLDQPLPMYADQPAALPLPFKHEITLTGLSFRYGPQSSWVFRNLDLRIAKGSRVGFIGTTGSGKSTLLDVVMGLLKPSEGVIKIDSEDLTTENLRAWQAHIAHVPQAIYLADSSIEENIAFGVPKEKIDHERVRRAARQAQIANIVESWPNQYQTFVGERGVRLSGGQRQRIGIARALYKQANVIIFDEATSALDSDTEEGVMQAIESLSHDLTILIIAHRLTTLKSCTQIVELGSNSFRVGSYEEIVGKEVRQPS